MPIVLDFVAANTAIVICFAAGMALLVLEAFMPGFGLPGISGGILGLASVVLTYISHGLLAAMCVLLVFLALLAIAVSMSLRSAAKGSLSKSRLVLNSTESNEAGYRSVEDMQVFIGREGEVISTLRPTGIAEFDGVRLNVSSEGTFIQPGVKVRIIRADGSAVIVRPV